MTIDYKNPGDVGYIEKLIKDLQKKKIQYQRDIQILQGRIAGIDDVFRHILEDTERSIPNIKESISSVNKIRNYQTEVVEESKNKPKKKKGSSIIERIMPSYSADTHKKFNFDAVKGKGTQ